jgi:serine/threonine protein phosphatase PrpC
MFGSGYKGTYDEFSTLEVSSGDRLMLCSDGITGDWDEQRIEPQIFARAFGQPTAAASAADFMAASKKSDDKSVIVIDIK